ncbi:MAG: sugar transferase [Melioribacteraceae bacterium]
MQRLLALLIFICISPIYILISILIFLEDGFPIHFKQKRPGLNHLLFDFYKFRSMKKNTPNVATHLLENPDQYLLKIGKVLRKFSLDELPNLINVIKGDMGFVGPRPALFNQYDLIGLREKYGLDKLKPGITGWAQINGRDELSIPDKVEYERYYLIHKSLLFDVKIFFLTILKAFTGKNVTH